MPWKSTGLVLLTPARYRATSFVAPTCVRGECKSDEVGVPVGAADDGGVLLDATYVADAKLITLSHAADGDPTCWDAPSKPDGARTCVTYAESPKARATIQVRAQGQVQENGYTQHQTIEWRTVDSSVASPWIAAPKPYGTSVPRPIGRLSSSSRDEIVWLWQEGICCPSASKAWVSYRADGTWKDGPSVSGGKGQPCD